MKTDNNGVEVLTKALDYISLNASGPIADIARAAIASYKAKQTEPVINFPTGRLDDSRQ